MKIKNSNITINVKDLDQSISFYKSIGLKEKERWGNYYAQLEAPGLVIGLHPTTDTKLSSGSISIGFMAEDFEDAKSHLINLSIAIQVRQEEGGQFIHFSDPDGTSLYIIRPKW